MKDIQVNTDDKNISIIHNNKIHILVTEEDKTGEDILAMSDFFGGYIQQLVDAIRTNAVTTYVPSIPFADVGIIGEEQKLFHREPHNCYLTLTVFLRTFARS